MQQLDFLKDPKTIAQVNPTPLERAINNTKEKQPMKTLMLTAIAALTLTACAGTPQLAQDYSTKHAPIGTYLDDANAFVAATMGVKPVAVSTADFTYQPIWLAAHNLKAMYGTNGKIYVGEETRDYHVIHELTHLYQKAYGINAKCGHEAEAQAIRVQSKWCETRDCAVHDEAYLVGRSSCRQF